MGCRSIASISTSSRSPGSAPATAIGPPIGLLFGGVARLVGSDGMRSAISGEVTSPEPASSVSTWKLSPSSTVMSGSSATNS